MTDLHICLDVADCPECRAGKHGGCNDLSWCNRHDGHEPCPCFLRQHGPASVIALGQPYEVSPEAAAELAAIVEQANLALPTGRMPPERLDEIRGEISAHYVVGSGTPRAAQERLLNSLVTEMLTGHQSQPEPPQKPTERQNAIVTLMAVLGAACENRSVDGWSEFHDRLLAALTTLGVTHAEMHAAVTAMDQSGVPWRT